MDWPERRIKELQDTQPASEYGVEGMEYGEIFLADRLFELAQHENGKFNYRQTIYWLDNKERLLYLL